MFKRSLLGLSGQVWKFNLAIVLLLGGSIAPLFPETTINMTVGSIVAIVGYVFGLVAISCSHCGSKWFWAAAKDAGYYGAIFKGSECPKCKHSYAGGVD
jgi:hypothetical protein